MKWIYNLAKPWRTTPEQRAAEHLYEARMELLDAQKQREYWQAAEKMYLERIARLSPPQATNVPASSTVESLRPHVHSGAVVRTGAAA